MSGTPTRRITIFSPDKVFIIFAPNDMAKISKYDRRSVESKKQIQRKNDSRQLTRDYLLHRMHCEYFLRKDFLLVSNL